jgi:N-carbamoylputrescine amidase
MMKICTTEFPDEVSQYDKTIDRLASHVSDTKPDLVVLPEMPFTPWIFHVEAFSQDKWEQTVGSHAKALEQLCVAIATPIMTSRPISSNGKNLNQAIYIDHAREIQPLRSKRYLPNDYPAVERVWFNEGENPNTVFDIQGCKIGIQLCSEIMYTEYPRLLGLAGAQVIIQPRATGDHARWRAASILAAATSSAFVVGANRRSSDRDWFTGASWVYSPVGDLLAETSETNPAVTHRIDLAEVNRAKSEYPMTMFKHYE